MKETQLTFSAQFVIVTMFIITHTGDEQACETPSDPFSIGSDSDDVVGVEEDGFGENNTDTTPIWRRSSPLPTLSDTSEESR